MYVGVSRRAKTVPDPRSATVQQERDEQERHDPATAEHGKEERWGDTAASGLCDTPDDEQRPDERAEEDERTGLEILD
jgi:hypothetical protein